MSTNYLVYSPCVYNRPDDNWLLDVELYSEEFRADLISIWMDEMGLISNPAMRKQVKNYRAYFNAKDRRLKVSTQNKVPETPAQFKKIECERECYAMHSSGKNSLAVGLSPYKIAKKDAFASKLAGRLFSPFCMARSVHTIFTK